MLYQMITLIFTVIRVLILLRVILSWVLPGRDNDFVRLVETLTEPILRPFRLLIPVRSMNIDLSPILAYYIIGLIENLIIRILIRFM